MRLLLRNGADITAVNCRGKTPKDVSRTPGILAVIDQAGKGNIEDIGSSSSEENQSGNVLLFYISMTLAVSYHQK